MEHILEMINWLTKHDAINFIKLIKTNHHATDVFQIYQIEHLTHFNQITLGT